MTIQRKQNNYDLMNNYYQTLFVIQLMNRFSTQEMNKIVELYFQKKIRPKLMVCLMRKKYIRIY